MALLPILRYPDTRLAKIALPVTRVYDPIRRLISDMAETMYDAPGIGSVSYTHLDVYKRQEQTISSKASGMCKPSP